MTLSTPPVVDPWRDEPHEVLLCNFGGPERDEDVEPFLRRLFEDPFIIRAPLPVWLRARLARRIARRRAPKVAAEYREIGYSPINRLTLVQAGLLEELLRRRRPKTRVHVVNRYSAPTADEVVNRLSPSGARIFALTLYPHFCHSTTVSSLRDLDLAWQRRHGAALPGVRIYSWWAEARYLELTAALVQAALSKLRVAHPDLPLTVLCSAHGLPRRYVDRGDPYVAETRAHFEYLRRRVQASGDVAWELSFQSRVGPVEWTRPYTDEEIRRLGRTRGGALLTVPISFTSDHIETLYEMDRTYAGLAREAGFVAYGRAAPANDNPELAATLADVLVRHGF